MTAFVSRKYIIVQPYRATSENAGPARPSIFRCPSTVVGAPAQPDGRTARNVSFLETPFESYPFPHGAAWTDAPVQYRSTNGDLLPMISGNPAAIDCWYGINGLSRAETQAELTNPIKAAFNAPFVSPRVFAGGGWRVASIRRASQVRKPAEVVAFYDGWLSDVLTNSTKFIASRHNGKKAVNIAFVDGHVETILDNRAKGTTPSSHALPYWADTAKNSFQNASQFNAIWTYPKWRLDQ